MVDTIIKELEGKMSSAIKALRAEFGSIRTGRASISLLDDVRVEYYNSQMPLNQVATLSTPDPHTIAIQPWDKAAIAPIEKAILKQNIGLTPVSDGSIIRISIPQLTEERRKEYVKIAGKYAENSRISIRNARRDANDKLKALEKKKEISEDELHTELNKTQQITDKYIKEVDALFEKKEKDIITI